MVTGEKLPHQNSFLWIDLHFFRLRTFRGQDNSLPPARPKPQEVARQVFRLATIAIKRYLTGPGIFQDTFIACPRLDFDERNLSPQVRRADQEGATRQ